MFLQREWSARGLRRGRHPPSANAAFNAWKRSERRDEKDSTISQGRCLLSHDAPRRAGGSPVGHGGHHRGDRRRQRRRRRHRQRRDEPLRQGGQAHPRAVLQGGAGGLATAAHRRSAPAEGGHGHQAGLDRLPAPGEHQRHPDPELQGGQLRHHGDHAPVADQRRGQRHLGPLRRPGHPRAPGGLRPPPGPGPQQPAAADRRPLRGGHVLLQRRRPGGERAGGEPPGPRQQEPPHRHPGQVQGGRGEQGRPPAGGDRRPDRRGGPHRRPGGAGLGEAGAGDPHRPPRRQRGLRASCPPRPRT